MPLSPLRPGDPAAIGGFRLSARLGAGGMGTVFLGADLAGRPVAVKVIREEIADDAEFRARFRRETTAAAAVSGPYVARLLAADPGAAAPWLATEYVPGPSLGDVVAVEGALDAGTAEALALGLAEALVAIHAAGVVHRDLKPHNVLLISEGPKVIDFGIATVLDGAGSRLTQTGIAFGSPGYMAPEQITARSRPGPPSDVFAWALTITFAATARPPYGTGPVAALAYRVAHETPDLDGLPDGLRPVAEAALRKDPADRPAAEELVRRLRPAADDPTPTTLLVRAAWHPPTTAALPAGTTAGTTAAAMPTDQQAPPAAPPGQQPPTAPPRPATTSWPGPGPAPQPTAAGPAAWWRHQLRGGVAAAVLIALAVIFISSWAVRSNDPPAPPGSTQPPSASPQVGGVAGTYEGSYVCPQGRTGLRLTIQATGEGENTVSALFEAFPLGAPPAPTLGSFNMEGTVTDGQLYLEATTWVVPAGPGWGTLDLRALVGSGNPDVQELSGRAIAPGCSTFEVTKV